MKKANQFALIILAICSFAIGTTEFIAAGILPNLATYFSISIPVAGIVISAYALGGMVGAPLLTIATIHMRRKQALVALLILFLIGVVVSAVAFSFSILIVGRVISALSQGAFFGIGSVVATRLVPPEKKARALALMYSGLTLANVLGVPFGTLLGQNFGWRTPFWAVSILSLLCLIGLFIVLPKNSGHAKTNLREELAVFKKAKVWLALATSAIGISGLFATFGYIAPMLIHGTGFTESSISWLIAIFGAGLVVGNFIGGKSADRNLKKTLYTFLTTLSLLLFLFSFTIQYKPLTIITLFLLGVVGFANIPALQMQVMETAKSAPTLASAVNIAALNLGITIGVSIAGFTISSGFGYTSPTWVGGCLTLFGLAIAFLTNKTWKTAQ